MVRSSSTSLRRPSLMLPQRRYTSTVSWSATTTSTSLHQSFINAADDSNENAEKNSSAQTVDNVAKVEKKEEDPWTPYVNRNNVRDQVVSAISSDGGIKVTAVTARNLINDVVNIHNLSRVAADALGRTMLCSILLSNGIPDEQTLQISYQTTGPLRGVLATCNGLGNVRGYVGTPRLSSSVSLSDAIGKESVLQIVKNHPKWKRPYNGLTVARYRDVDRDVGIYLAESEQRSCALAAALAITDDTLLLCTAAGGYLIEQLPGVTDHERELVERNLAELVALDGGDALPTNLLGRGTTPLELVQLLLKDLDPKPLQQITPLYKCECSEERLIRSLRLLPRVEVEDILTQQEQIEARCEFCGTVYRMGPVEVREALKEQPSSSSD
jgi:molecular chaperone Hsp33